MATNNLILFLSILFLGFITIQAELLSENDEQEVLPFIRSLEYLYSGIAPPRNGSMARSFSVKTEWISQKVDNFNANSPTWNMRYMSNGEFHQTNGPIFIFVGGEGEISDGWLKSGLLYDLAREYKGYLFQTEHRYYGQSYPTSDLSIANLKYLSSAQALADLANFIRTQKAKPQFAKSKVILASGSYPGSLTVWFQRLYPDLVDGSWASSAPLLAKVAFPEFKEVVATAFYTIGGEACYNRLYNGIQRLEQLVDTRQFSEFKRLMKVCDNFNGDDYLDVASMFASIGNVAAGIVQSYSDGDIEKECKVILSASDDVSGVAKWYNGKIGSTSCLDYSFDASIGYMKSTQKSSSMWRQWTYQLCTEFGFSHTSNSQYQPFGTKVVVQYFENVCNKLFGITRDQFYANVARTNANYGGLNPNVKKVFYSHGGIDPWYPAGIQRNDDGSSAIIPGVAHCQDFDSISSYDIPEMRASKEKLKTYIRKWLA